MAGKSPQQTPQSPNPSHVAQMSSPSSTSSFSLTSPLMITTLILTTLALAIGGLYMSGQADDMFRFFAKKYYIAEAKAEEKALEKAGTEKVQGFLKERLKNNPMVDRDELNDVSEGLGDEAEKEGGLAARVGKAFD